MKEVFAVATIDINTGAISIVPGKFYDNYAKAQEWITEESPAGQYQVQKIFLKG